MHRYRLAAMILLLAFFLSCTTMAADVTSTTAVIGDQTAQIVYVRMSGSSVLTPVLANRQIGYDLPFGTVLSSEPKTVAAINGSFFNCYYEKDEPISINTGNYPRIYGAIVKDGKMINSGGSAAVGFGYDGSIVIGAVTLGGCVTVNGAKYVAWGVNAFYDQPSSIFVLTEEMAYPVDIPSTSTVVLIRDDVITAIQKGTSQFRVPYGSVAMVVDQNYRLMDFSVGDKAEYGYTVVSGDSGKWSGLRNIIGGSGLLVKDGASYVDSNASMTAEDQDPDKPSERTFIALTGDGRLMLCTVYGTFRKIADSLISMGVTDAMILDGGASTLLYANGRAVHPARRDLASVIAITDSGSGASVPPAGSSPSAWAKAEVEAAINAGLVPQNLQGSYQSPVSRGAVAQMFVYLLEKSKNASISDVLSSENVQINPSAFSDTSDPAVLAANALGIINGTGNGKFSPQLTLTRAQIAAIINRVAKVMGYETAGYTHSFTDVAGNWVDAELGWPVHAGVLQGVGNNRFDPDGTLTVEQAIATTYRAYLFFQTHG